MKLFSAEVVGLHQYSCCSIQKTKQEQNKGNYHLHRHIQSSMKHLRKAFEKVVNDVKLITIFTKSCIIDA